MSNFTFDFTLAIGDAAGQGVATQLQHNCNTETRSANQESS